MYRPKDLKNPFSLETITAKNVFTGKPISHYDAFEAGADAALKAQFREGDLYCLHDNGGLTIKSWACPICRKELKESLGL